MQGDKTIDDKTASANRDPLPGAPGAHPVGAVVGGLSGKGVAESVDPAVEDACWRENYASRDCIAPGAFVR